MSPAALVYTTDNFIRVVLALPWVLLPTTIVGRAYIHSPSLFHILVLWQCLGQNFGQKHVFICSFHPQMLLNILIINSKNMFVKNKVDCTLGDSQSYRFYYIVFKNV